MNTIAVGLDGSESAKRALRWALEEARLRGARLRVIHVWSPPHFSGFDTEPPDLGRMRGQAAQTLARLVREAIGDPGDVEVEHVLREGPPAPELIAAASDADLLVVGSRGLGGFKELLLGSVAHQCALHAQCPVLIVRG
jgi:nucleotide-binding universal stress UspA family protein